MSLTADDIRAVRAHPLCNFEDKDKMDAHIGWLICAYDAIIEHRGEVSKRKLRAEKDGPDKFEIGDKFTTSFTNWSYQVVGKVKP